MTNTFKHNLNIVVAYTFDKQGIGYNGSIPWNIPEDMKHFKKLTSSKYTNENNHISTNNTNNGYEFSIVIMGRKTWDSIPDKHKPLSNRFNIILSNDSEYRERLNAEYNSHNYNNDDNDNDKFNNSFGVYFTTWDLLFNEGGYLEIENSILGDTNKTNTNILLSYYIIGGEQIYKKALEMCSELDLTYTIHATEIYTENKKPIICNTFCPKFDMNNMNNMNNMNKENNIIITNVSPFYKYESSITNTNTQDLWFRHITYVKSSITNTHKLIKPFYSQETEYLSLMRNILQNGSSNDDRTGVGTISIFGAMLKYNLQDTFPLCTTKRMFFRAIFEELMFYLSGKTDNKILQAKGIHVWDGNTSREFLDKRGLTHYEEGDMGQTYGFNYRHFGGEYKGCGFNYDNMSMEHEGLQSSVGYDQVANVIHLIKTEPSSRRIIIDLWDCSTIDKAALPSCLCKYQFNVNTTKKELNLAIYLRSSDYFLANNWNSCCGALFVHLLCNLEGIDLTPGELTVFIADAHLYKTHLEQVKINLERKPYPFPKLIVKGDLKGKKKDIMDFKFEDIELLGYKAHPNIKAEMAI